MEWTFSKSLLVTMRPFRGAPASGGVGSSFWIAQSTSFPWPSFCGRGGGGVVVAGVPARSCLAALARISALQNPLKPIPIPCSSLSVFQTSSREAPAVSAASISPSMFRTRAESLRGFSRDSGIAYPSLSTSGTFVPSLSLIRTLAVPFDSGKSLFLSLRCLHIVSRLSSMRTQWPPGRRKAPHAAREGSGGRFFAASEGCRRPFFPLKEERYFPLTSYTPYAMLRIAKSLKNKAFSTTYGKA
jgi:hypothetical protein